MCPASSAPLTSTAAEPSSAIVRLPDRFAPWCCLAVQVPLASFHDGVFASGASKYSLMTLLSTTESVL